MSEWISVKDRLPELRQTPPNSDFYKSDFVLCHNIPNGYHMAAPEIWIFYLYKYRDEDPKWMYIGENDPGVITHWMPLPDPPKVTI